MTEFLRARMHGIALACSIALLAWLLMGNTLDNMRQRSTAPMSFVVLGDTVRHSIGTAAYY